MAKTKQTKPYHYVALGDSLANGVGAPAGQSYAHQLNQELTRRQPVVFSLFAVNGQTSTQLLRRWPKYQQAISQANLITWNIGGNDIRLTWRIYGQRPMPKAILQKRMQQTLVLLQDNWDTLARQLRQTAPPRAKIITINQYDPYLYQNAATSNFITLANQALADICAKYSITVIDAYTICHQQQYFSKDKLHLNQAGYTRLFQAINRALHPTIISRLKTVLNKALW